MSLTVSNTHRIALGLAQIISQAGGYPPLPDRLNKYMEHPLVQFIKLCLMVWVATGNVEASLAIALAWTLAMTLLSDPYVDDPSRPHRRDLHNTYSDGYDQLSGSGGVVRM